MSAPRALRTGWIATLRAGTAAHVDWDAWRRLPRRLVPAVTAIEHRTCCAIVAYRRHGSRPASTIPPCRVLAPAAMTRAALAHLRGLERAAGVILVAYRLPSARRRR